MARRVLLTLYLVTAPAWLAGQVTSTDRSVTVTASRNGSVAPDLGVFGVDVLTPPDATLDDALAVVQSAGITAANFSSVYTTTRFDIVGKANASRDYLDWSFTLTAPLGSLKATVAQLAALQTAVAKKDNGIAVTYSMRGTQTSPQALAAQNCAAVDLVGDARAQAQKLAAGAGLSVGAVLSVAGSSVVTPASRAFSSGTVQPSCTLTVKFALAGL